MTDLSLRGQVYIPRGLRMKRTGAEQAAPKMVFYKVDKTHPSPRTEPLRKGKQPVTTVLYSMPSSFSHAHPECPAEGVSRRYLIKRKLFHFNTP